MPQWTAAFPLASLAPGRSRLFRHANEVVAVWRTEEGDVYAVDNRCPHEGYPLVQGAIKGCTLTCNWHNFKFDLPSGACTMGDEAVRTFPVRIVAESVEVDVEPRPGAEALPRLWRSLEAGLLDRKQGQMARDVVRLLEAGVDPVGIAAFGASYDALRAEYGPSHALPVALDILAFLPAHPGIDAAFPLVQALDVAAEACLRRAPRTRGAPLAPGTDPVAELNARIEAEDAAGAEGLVRGMVAAGLGRGVLEPALNVACATHFLDFGHALIYQSKVFDLLDRVGWEHADVLLGAHAYGIATGTREDLLPSWSGFRNRLAVVDLAELDSRTRTGSLAADALVDLDARAAFGLVVTTDAPADAILAALSRAAAERLLRFDVAIDGSNEVQEDWLDVTHRLTFVEAVRRVCRSWPDPRRWRLLLLASHFVAGARPMDGPRPDTSPQQGAPLDLATAVSGRDRQLAVRIAAGLLEAGDPAGIRGVLDAACLADGVVRGIVVAHLIKTNVAAFAEYELTGDPTPVLATVRLFASPVQERRVARLVGEAIRLVRDGKPPHRLTD